jgi:hypothetical protein
MILVKSLAVAMLAVAMLSSMELRPAHAQRECGNYNCGFLGHPSTWTRPWGQPRAPQTTPSVRAINVSPVTGRPYSTEAPSYLQATPKQRKARQKLEQMQ